MGIKRENEGNQISLQIFFIFVSTNARSYCQVLVYVTFFFAAVKIKGTVPEV